MFDINMSELEFWIQDLESDIKLLTEMVRDPMFLSKIEDLVNSNFDRVFETQGLNIGSDWQGNDLVDTGRLKLSLTTKGQLDIQVSGNEIVFSSSVSYSSLVNDRFVFYGIDDEFDSKFNEIVSDFLIENGKLEWTN